FSFVAALYQAGCENLQVFAAPLSAGSWPATGLFPVQSPSAREAPRETPPPSLIKIDVDGGELPILQGGAGVLRDHRPILCYESFNHRAEILALLKGYGYLVFESDRYQAIVPETINFIALPLDRAPAVT